MTSELVTLGETMALMSSPQVGPLRHARALHLSAAGSESNVAIGFQRLGGRATWIGRVGADEFGAMVAETVRGTGVQTVAITDPDAPTGLMVKERRSADLGRVVYYRRDSAGSRLTETDLGDHIGAGVRVVHVSGITAALSASARATVSAAITRAREVGALVSVDLNHRAALWSEETAGPVLADLTKEADVVFATEEEARLVVPGADAEELAAGLAALGPQEVVVKRGAHGCVSRAAEQTRVVPALTVPVVDSVGAGDAFAAGYLLELCRGESLERRLHTATRTGAYAVTVDGDWEGAPGYDELADLDVVSGTILR